MKNRLLLTAAWLVFSGIVFVSCNKERMPPPSNARQVVSSESKSSGSTSATPSSGTSSEGPASGGCSSGHGG